MNTHDETEPFVFPQSTEAAHARAMLLALRTSLAQRLAAVGGGTEAQLGHARWLRDGGAHGGGDRILIPASLGFCTASLNFSQVHYDDVEDKRLGSATALSCIMHPSHPMQPSLHTHLSWTEMKDGAGSWRLMADLNPATPVDADTDRFRAAMDAVCGDRAAEARDRGDDYFWIPALERHRGVAHYYFERSQGATLAQGRAFARAFGEACIETYAGILAAARADGRVHDEAAVAAQIAYHSLYLYQVLTLDRGTTSGLLVHDQNDVGILGSLPPSVDTQLLASWGPATPAPQDTLLGAIIEVLEETGGAVTSACKPRLASLIRRHYRAHPEGLKMQAGNPNVALAADHHRTTKP